MIPPNIRSLHYHHKTLKQEIEVKFERKHDDDDDQTNSLKTLEAFTMIIKPYNKKVKQIVRGILYTMQ